MAKLPEIIRLALEFRARLAAGEATATTQVVEAYGAVFNRLRPQIVSALENRGDGSPEAQFERARLGSILGQLEAEVSRISGGVAAQIGERQRALSTQAGSDANALTRAALDFKAAQRGAPPGFTGPTWRELGPRQLEELASTLNARPVSAILREMAPTAVDELRRSMLAGLGNGEQPTQIARALGNTLGVSAARSATVMRTEDMRAYRESTLASFRENVEVVKGWKWVASLSGDTCAACIAMHGTEFKIGEAMDSHPNCRCVQVPITATWAELGFPDVRDVDIPLPSGEEWLLGQPESVQKRALGLAKFDAWKAGDIRLDDLRGHTTSQVWGGMNFEVSLATARQSAARRSQ